MSNRSFTSTGWAVPAVDATVRPGRTGVSSPSDPEETAVEIRHGVKGLVTSSGRALLVKERHADGTPFWTLPGGRANDGESLTAALRRELSEELNCRSVVDQQVSAFWYAHLSRQHTCSVYAVFECALLSAAMPSGAEGILEHRWVTPAELPTTTLPQVQTLVETALSG
jgi:8-oxo-dGTP diphosphatase